MITWIDAVGFVILVVGIVVLFAAATVIYEKLTESTEEMFESEPCHENESWSDELLVDEIRDKDDEQWKIKWFDALIDKTIEYYCPSDFYLNDINFKSACGSEWCDNADEDKCRECFINAMRNEVQENEQ